MSGATSVIQEDVPHSVTGRVESSGSDPFVQSGALHLLQEAAVFVRMRTADSKRLSRATDIIKKKLAFDHGKGGCRESPERHS